MRRLIIIVGQKPAVFLLKTDSKSYSWPYPTHDAGFWPQPTHERQQTRGLWPRGVCPGGFGGTPPETIGDNRTEFNRILCTSKSEAAVTSNKKLLCRYVEADYRQTRSIARPLCDSWASCFHGIQRNEHSRELAAISSYASGGNEIVGVSVRVGVRAMAFARQAASLVIGCGCHRVGRRTASRAAAPAAGRPLWCCTWSRYSSTSTPCAARNPAYGLCSAPLH